MEEFKLLFLVFVFLCGDVIGAEFVEGANGSLSGSLGSTKLQFSSGVVDLKIEGTVSADLEDERMNSTFFLKGGTLNLDGGDNTINIKAVCSSGCKAYMYLISATSGSLSVRNSVFCVNDHWASVMCLNNTDNVELISCKLKGTPFQFASVANTSQLTISKCNFEKLEKVSKMVHLFDGFIFRLVNCSNTKMEDCVFRKVNAGSYKKGAIGWAAPVYMEDCAGVTISKCKFQKCSGIMAGAIYSFTTNSENTYTDLVLKGNRCKTPAGEIMSLVTQDPLGLDGLSTVFAEYVSNPAAPGNDITRVGNIPIPVAGSTCSTSKKPHYRNGLDETNFKSCPLPAGAIVGIVLGPIAFVIAVVIIVLACWHCRGCCVYRYRHTPFNKQNEMAVFPDKSDVPVDGQDGKEGKVEPVEANQEDEEENTAEPETENENRDSLAARK